MTKKARVGAKRKKSVKKSQTFPKANAEAPAKIATQGGVEAAEPKPTKCQDSLYFAIKSIAPLGDTGSAPPLIAPNLCLDAIREIKKVKTNPNNSGRFRRVCQLDRRGLISIS